MSCWSSTLKRSRRLANGYLASSRSVSSGRGNPTNDAQQPVAADGPLRGPPLNRSVVAEDMRHGAGKEHRYFCLGRIGGGILTVRFTYRKEVIRILGAGYWRKGKRIYEKQNPIH
ncbi:MAG: BrnT family toxin [Nitrospirae bacterium]|nr:BrnT family toxin [Nitrospirota bacterium]